MSIKKLLIAGKEVGTRRVCVHLDRRFAPQPELNEENEETLLSLWFYFEEDKGISLSPKYGRAYLLEKRGPFVEPHQLYARTYPDFSCRVSVVNDPFLPAGQLAICLFQETPTSDIVGGLVAVQYTDEAGKELAKPTQIVL